MPTIVLPQQLIEAVKGVRVVPFLGAGASKEAIGPGGARPPDANQLRDVLALRFFGRPIPNRDLMTVAEMAIRSGGGQSLVFDEVRKIFEPFSPSDAHKALADFNWRMIATTNYDLLIEHAYSEVKARRQNLVRFVKDDEPIEARLQEIERSVPYLKLHGCLDHIHDSDIPPVLTKESYSRFKRNRTRLFDRIKSLSHESTILFIGYRLDDQHIRNMIYDIGIDKRPRWFLVTPDAEEYDIEYWGTQNVGVIRCRFGEFMDALSSEIPPLLRHLAHSTQTADFPVRRHFRTNEQESLKLRQAFAKDFTYIHASMPTSEQTPEQFYQGYDTGWGGIINRLDVRRKVEDDLLYKALLENEKPAGPNILMLRGAAGAGKTIALKRTAFEAATASDALALWLEEGGALHFDVLSELHELTRKPIYLFVDQIGFRITQVLSFLRSAQARSLPVIVIGAERDADWNTYCGALEAEFPPEFVRVGNLSVAEVEGLLDLLARHGCLGLLGKLPRADQVNAFMDENRADRQLLVALHELTLGKPFEKIILEEHQRIFPEQAQQLYLDIATMHQFSVSVRAGIISRISGIAFDDFQTRFLEPLRSIVRVVKEPYSDVYYKTRHPRVASIVFREICSTDQLKSKQLRRIVESLDIGYSVDKRALEEICRGRMLAETFSSIDNAREVYQAAIDAAPTQAFLYQQWALMEANHSEGSLTVAERLASKAHDIDPRSKSIIHTQAEIDRKRANDEESDLLKDSLRRRARERLDALPTNDRFAASSRCKLLVDEVADLGAKADATGSSNDALAYAEKVKVAENAILRAQQTFPEDADIDQVEARFRHEVDEEEKALRALEQALATGKVRGSGTAIKVARIYDARGRSPDALKTLRAALGRSPDDKPTHHAMAMHLMNAEKPDLSVIENHLRRSFSTGDRNFENRFDLAQVLFLSGQLTACETMFAEIDRDAPNDFRRSTPQNENVFSKRLDRYSGRIKSIKPGYVFLHCAAYPSDILGHRSMTNKDVFDDLMIGDEINFRIRFNRQGPTAVDIKAGRLKAPV